ncbi:MAG: ATP phosphoribosyltransferase [Desulfarculus sp.]|nr:ATP phosphoribosyltransferase [Desulfarculus sp.]
MKEPLKLGVPKGSLQEATVRLFARAGWKINVNGRSYFPEIDDDEIDCSICRAQEMSRYVESGTLDAGITGRDWILENDSDVHYVDELIYSKVSARPARWVLAVARDSGINDIGDLKGKRIATEMVNFTRRYFEDQGVPVEVHFSWGATEAKVVNGLADAIVEVTETGSTIKAHGLKIIKDLMQSTTQLIANKTAWANPEKRQKIEQLALLLKGALVAQKMVGLKMNVPKLKLTDIVEVLPSLNAPTVANLYNSDWFSVETVVDESIVRDLIPKLLRGGAEGIIEYSLNKVI